MNPDEQEPEHERRFGLDESAGGTPDLRRAWFSAGDELAAQGWREPQPVAELLDTITAPGIDRYLDTSTGYDIASVAAVDRRLVEPELRLVDRQIRQLDIDDDRALVHELRCARGRLN
ncbi:hypothetical protein ACFYTF_29070 [Nocardia thailandica]|uniref:Uncharacterized protein n=1 Tax=Nocardia thailandica TaxID=257275 RepID=A0ABW6PWS3_9NOCA